MKRHLIMAVIAAAVVVLTSGGCVSSRQFDALASQLDALASQNHDLQQQIAAVQRPTAPVSQPEQPVTSGPPPAIEQPRPAPRPMPMGGPGYVAPALPFPPQNWARAYGPPEIPGCQAGILSVSVENETDFYVSVFIDGQEVRVFGAGGNLPHLPPRQTAYACLEHPGLHAIQGVVYARRGSQMIEVQRFSMSRDFSLRTIRSSGRQRISVTNTILNLYRLR
ncbi:hypothetical protein COY93_03665 [Candidatus Uhrbacteria bacterium CG_4_10_14_0_8_um_filter_58_22]|uniref:Uncharacterized protein n=1 Tax=Candidatus Uhrbacteria bacterium CG_4_10_14_0_8_um_filter_58_22 TaxID=1975029 RepID=A0A2M7Q9C3_9BACT|nr:MAG: hypothetical protein AUJ19_02640 [Parcubacteria group bacterium CG1_02_58_44]PIY62187.1 MAG: hypothetical protein COY93_03665 [Candidatus Uhrbacteria bacterium CG_4_10_14_0_8_um_filter_58_22]